MKHCLDLAFKFLQATNKIDIIGQALTLESCILLINGSRFLRLEFLRLIRASGLYRRGSRL